MSAIQTDDPDIRPAWMYMDHGGNGDYYLSIVEIKDQFTKDGELKKMPIITTMRFSTSGGTAPQEIRLKIVEIYRLMKQLNLNQYPDEEIRRNLSR